MLSGKIALSTKYYYKNIQTIDFMQATEKVVKTFRLTKLDTSKKHYHEVKRKLSTLYTTVSQNEVTIRNLQPPNKKKITFYSSRGSQIYRAYL